MWYVKESTFRKRPIDNVKYARKIMMHGEKHRGQKEVIMGEYRKSLMFAEYYIFTPFSVLKRWMKDAVSRFHKAKKDDLIIAVKNLFRDIIHH